MVCNFAGLVGVNALIYFDFFLLALFFSLGHMVCNFAR